MDPSATKTFTPARLVALALIALLVAGLVALSAGRDTTTTLSAPASVFLEQPDAGARLITAFFDSGHVDDSLYVPAGIDFTPPMTFGILVRIVLGSMLGVVAVSALSLVAMAARVRRRGRIGGRASAVLRSIFPLVLGLGGWSLGALIVLTTMPTVRIDNEALIVGSVGAPVALGIYWAWVHRAWSVVTKRAGRAAVVIGTFAGAWLGFHAGSVEMAMITTIAGAIAGGNLGVIVVDLWRATSGRKVAPATPVDVHTAEPPAPVTIGVP